MLAAIIHWGGINNNEELYFDTDTYNVAIVKPLTDDLRSRILRPSSHSHDLCGIYYGLCP